MKKWVLPILMLFVFEVKGQRPMLFGMTQIGGTNDSGVIFSFDLLSGTETVLHNFERNSLGFYPSGSLLQSNGHFYGMAHVLFDWNISDSTYNSLGYGSGTGSLISDGGNLLFGLTHAGGVDNNGSIFSYNKSNQTETTLHSFSFSPDTDGSFPDGSLLLANNGLLYGFTTAGPGNTADSQGVLFNYDISSKAYSILHYFVFNVTATDTDGIRPIGTLIQASDNLLYGMTSYGGHYNQGTIFSYNISTGKETILHSFGGNLGAQNPLGSLLQANNGLLYGMTRDGGLKGNGQIFSYDISTGIYSDLHDFGNNGDGALPYSGSLMQASNGLLYGMTCCGGVYSDGTIFSYNISTDTEIVVYSFKGTDGASPLGDLIEVDLATSVSQLSGAFNLSIYPNPSTGQFTIQLPVSQNNYPTEIYNTLGQKIQQLTLSNGINTVNLSNQPAGMYFVDVQTESGNVGAKVVVTK